MKILFYKSFFACLCMIMCAIGFAQDPECLDNTEISLPPWGNAHFFSESDLSSHDFDSDSFTASPAFVDCSNIGTPVIVECTFVNGGVTTFCDVEVVVEDQVAPTVIVNNLVHVSLNQNGEAFLTHDVIDENSIDNCTPMSELSYSLEPAYLNCENIGENIVTLTVTDAYGNQNSAWSTVIVEDKLGGNMVCIADVEIDVTNDPHQLTLDDVIEDYTGACEEALTLTVETNTGFIIPDNYITADFAGLTLIATVTHEGTDDSCWTSVYVNGNPGEGFTICDTECWATPVTDCNGGHSDTDNIEWPCTIDLYAYGADPEHLTPENLVNIYGVHPMDAEPTLINYFGDWIYIGYEDIVIPVSPDGELFKIVRKWTVLNWYSGEVSEYSQIIKNIETNSPICDTLSRLSPVTDCEMGHSLNDDVEWPEDLFIADHRITPDELINISGVDPLDAKPSFYNNPNDYTYSYYDIFVGLTSTDLLLERLWTVTNPAYPNVSWNYGQNLTVDITDFGNLVTVNTITNRPVPGVEVTEGEITNNQGLAMVLDSDVLAPWKSDDVQNGLSILDVTLIRLHILGALELEELQLSAADVNSDLNITTLDIIEIQKAILGINSTVKSDWRFQETTPEVGVDTRAHYKAYKPGDVDDSAFLGTIQKFDDQLNVGFDDVLLNAGETYEIPVYLTEESMALGYEIRLNIESEHVSVEDIYTDQFVGSVSWSESNGDLTILSNNPDVDVENFEGSKDDPLFTISLTAKVNSVLSWGMFFNEQRPSFIVDENKELMLLAGEVNGGIVSGTENLLSLDDAINVFPNPVQDELQVNIWDEDFTQDGSVYEVYGIAGNLVRSGAFSPSIDVRGLSEGVYVLNVRTSERQYRTKIQVIR